MHDSPAPDVTPPTIAVLGLGRMGTPITRNLLAAGFPVVAWNRQPARVAALAEAGLQAAATPAEAAAAADIILTMLTDGDAIAEVLAGPAGVLTGVRRGTTWIQMATIGIEWTDHFAAVAAEHGMELVDAPVSGSDGPARAGELVILASGPPARQEQVQPVFDAIGRTTLWLGPAGNGTRLKVALNNWLAVQVEGIAETIALADAMGLDAATLIDAIEGGPLGSPYAVAKGRAMIAADFAPGFALRLAFKDVGLSLGAARRHRLDLPVTAAISRRWQTAMVDHGDDDVDSVIAVATTRDPARTG
jgi:3-hydroxyisobutyrate dehydrogenase